MSAWVQDLRSAVRSLARSPGYTAAVLVVLALGIGANAAIFSLVHGTLLRPLPYPDAERIVRVRETFSQGRGRGSVSLQNLQDWRSGTDAFDAIGSFWWASRNLLWKGEPERISVLEVSAGLLDVLGARPALGGLFDESAEQPGAPRVALLTAATWRDRFGSDEAVVGTTMSLDGIAYTIVGVLPESLRFPVWGDTPALFLPHVPPPDTQRGNHYLSVLAKVRPDRTIEQAREELVGVAARLEREYPDNQTGRSVLVEALGASVRAPVEEQLRLLFGAVILLLAIACANLAGLALARAAGRQRDVAVRAALGASRLELARPFLVESLALAVAGAAIGALLAESLLRLLSARLAAQLPRLGPIELDGATLAFLTATALVTGLAFGAGPAIVMTRRDVSDRLGDGGARTTGDRRRRLARRGLVVAQLALSLALLLGAGLLLRTFQRLQSTPSGFDPGAGVLTFHLSPAQGEHAEGTLASSLLSPVLERIRAVPGVTSAGLVSILPIQNWGSNSAYTIDGLEPPPPGEEWWVEARAASPGAFAALGVPVVAGRPLAETDGTSIRTLEEETPAPVVVNQAFVRRHFPDGRAVGRRVLMWGLEMPIVGVVGDVRQAGLDRDPLPELSLAYNDPRLESMADRDVVVVVRTAVPPTSIVGAVRSAVSSVDPALPIHTVSTLDDVVEASLGRRRLTLALTLAFAGLALLLAATGIYGLVAYLVEQRQREIGLRMALGATARAILSAIVREDAALAAVGVAVGLPLAWSASRIVSNQLHGVSPLDPWTWIAAALFVAALAVASGLAPAIRASRTEPSVVLREQ